MNSFINEFRSLEPTLVGNGGEIGDIRRHAIETFASTGFPTNRQEAWRFTNVGPIAAGSFAPAPLVDLDKPARESIAEWLNWFAAHDLVFVNGRLIEPMPGRSDPSGYMIPLDRFLETDVPRAREMLGKTAGMDEFPFTALNTAYMCGGAAVMVPPGVVVDKPFHILHVAVESVEPVQSHVRNLIQMGEDSEATIVESYVSLLSEPGGSSLSYFRNAVTEASLLSNSRLTHIKIQAEGESAYHLGRTAVHQGRDSSFTSAFFSFGSILARNEIEVCLSEPGANADLSGIYLGLGEQHLDCQTLVDHAAPHTSSTEIYKEVLGGRSRAVFNGRIVVRADAQKTNAQQQNRNLLISEEARVDTKPQLEILANDVKCSHGSTVGQLDPDRLFYLRSRGIDGKQARNILVRAFAGEFIDGIQVEGVRKLVDSVLSRKLPGSEDA